MATKKPQPTKKNPSPVDLVKGGVKGYKNLLNALDTKKLKK